MSPYLSTPPDYSDECPTCYRLECADHFSDGSSVEEDAYLDPEATENYLPDYVTEGK